MENNIAVALHQNDMDLYDFGKIRKAKGYPISDYQNSLEMAFILDLEAALLIQNIKGEEVRHAAYPRSAGWLAYKCGKYMEARQLARLGLSHTSTISAYEKEKLNELLEKVNEKINELELNSNSENFSDGVLAVVSSADIDDKSLRIRRIGDMGYQTINVSPDRIIDIARLFIGQTVEIEITKDDKGEMILQDIRRAA